MGMVYTWLAVIVIAIVVEVIVPGLVSIWFVPSALVAMLLSFASITSFTARISFSLSYLKYVE